MHIEHKGFYYALLAVLFSSGMSLFVKLGSSATVGVLVFARFALGVPIFLWVIRTQKLKLSWKEVPKNLTRSFAGIANLYAFYYALHSLPLVNAITLASTAPLFLPLMYLVWSKILVSKRRFFAAGLGFLGVLVILRPATSEFLVIGSLLALLSGFFRAVAIFNVRSLAKTEKTETILSYYFFIGAAVSFFPIWFDYEPIQSASQWTDVLFAGVMALGYQYTFTKACAMVPATKVSSINYLAVVIGGLLGWWVFGEVPDIWVLVGALLIVAGAMIALFDRAPPKHLSQ
ncbi:MAG: DMT family transporter [Parachlamydiales bacterium]|nr:DMT family transporter [Parachlamydiales bacterium]